MAKKKYSYRKKKQYARTAKDYVWQPCTTKEKERLENGNVGYKFEFKENKPPEPTPNMIEENKE